MQIIWKNNKNKRPRVLQPCPANLPFQPEHENDDEQQADNNPQDSPATTTNDDNDKNGSSAQLEKNLALSERFQAEGNAFAEEGKYGDALGKWEAAISLTPGRAVLHEQKAQVLLEIGKTWKALQAAQRATELESSWAEAWVTLSHAQLNFGEPELSVESAKKALEVKPNCKDAKDAMQDAMRLIANKKRLEQSGLQFSQYRYFARDSENDISRPVNVSNGSDESVVILHDYDEDHKPEDESY